MSKFKCEHQITKRIHFQATEMVKRKMVIRPTEIFFLETNHTTSDVTNTACDVTANSKSSTMMIECSHKRKQTINNFFSETLLFFVITAQ